MRTYAVRILIYIGGELMQKRRVRLGACNFILLIVPRRYFCCGSNCFVFWSQIFVLFEPYVRIILVQFRYSKLSSSGSLFFRSGFKIIAHSKLGFDLTIRKYNPSSK